MGGSIQKLSAFIHTTSIDLYLHQNGKESHIVPECTIIRAYSCKAVQSHRPGKNYVAIKC